VKTGCGPAAVIPVSQFGDILFSIFATICNIWEGGKKGGRTRRPACIITGWPSKEGRISHYKGIITSADKSGQKQGITPVTVNLKLTVTGVISLREEE